MFSNQQRQHNPQRTATKQLKPRRATASSKTIGGCHNIKVISQQDMSHLTMQVRTTHIRTRKADHSCLLILAWYAEQDKTYFIDLGWNVQNCMLIPIVLLLHNTSHAIGYTAGKHTKLLRKWMSRFECSSHAKLATWLQNAWTKLSAS